MSGRGINDILCTVPATSSVWSRDKILIKVKSSVWARDKILIKVTSSVWERDKILIKVLSLAQTLLVAGTVHKVSFHLVAFYVILQRAVSGKG